MLNKYWKRKGFLSGMRTFLSSVAVFGILFLPALLGNSVHATNHSISLSTDSDISIDVLSGKSTIQSSSVNVTTTCKAGYDLMLSTSGNDNHLYPNGDSSSSAGTYFNPSDGSTTLSNAADTWGYSLDISSGTPATLTPPTSNNVFLSVPTANHTPALIRTTRETASETSIDDDISIYYGVNASYNLAGGTYQMKNDTGTNNPGSIVYYAIMNPICAIDLELGFNENLDGAGAEGTDNTIDNFPTENDNTADVSNNTLTLSSKVPARSNYVFTGWNTAADGSGISYQPGAVIRIGDGTNELTGDVTLYAMWEVGTAYVVTLSFNEQGVNNVEFHHTTYATQEVTENGGIVVLRPNENYSFIINYKNGYKTNTITTTANGTIGNTTVSGITYTATGDDTITITASQKTGTTTLDTGQNFNKKIKTLAEGQNTSYGANSSEIKTLKTASFLPTDFVSDTSNTVSISGSPVYIFFDDTNEAGIMYFYTEARDVYMNTDSSHMLYGNTSLTDISALSNWNTSNVTNMSNMFGYTYSLTDISALSDWDTGSVINMNYMFYQTYSLTDISALSEWDTSSVTNMSGMFQYAYSLTNASVIDDWDIRAVTATAGNSSSSSNKFYYMFYGAPTHPNFTKRLGTWNANGTFITTSDTTITVTVDLDDHIKAVSFTDSTYGTRTVTKDGGTIVIPSGVQQDITVSYYDDGYTFDAWSITNGTLGSTSSSTTTLTASSDTTLAVTSTLASTSTVTISPDAHFSSIIFKNPNYGTKTITSSDINNNNNTITLINNLDYSIIVNYEKGYKTNAITTTVNGTLGTITVSGITYTITGNDTITITTSLKTGTTTLASGTSFNGKIKTLAEGQSTSFGTVSSKIKALRMASFLPTGFVPDSTNTVSVSGSPVYIFFDNTDEAGIMYFYTEAHDIYMNASSSHMFYSNTALTDISGLSNWNASSATSINNMFYQTYSLTDISALADWNTSSVTSMGYMFYNAYSLTDISALTNWDTSNVTNMSYMFQGAYSLTDISALADWDTSNVTNMSFMFQSARSLTDISALADWDTGSVTTMQTMFNVVQSLTDISALSNWDTSSVTNMYQMFGGNSFTNVSALASWNTSSVTDMHNMFSGAMSLTDISALSNWDTSSVTNMSGMFQNNYSITDISALSNWDTSSVANMSYMFNSAYSLINVSVIDGWDVRTVTATAGDSSSSNNKFYYMFKGVPAHPNFTMRAGTWNSDGTFIPSS